MSGIAGICNFKGSPVKKEEIQDMIKVLNHRGPDDEGIFLSSDIFPNSPAQAGFGHKRLSIIDITSGHQPISNEDGSIWVILDGEIYNFQDLRIELTEKGHRFKTHSDTEVILHLYEEMDTFCVQHLRGTFAFAIWDSKKERLFLARDRVGKKPVSYFSDGNSFIFASEIKSILECGLKRELDCKSLDFYLTYGYTPSPDTIFKGIKKLPAAHTLLYDKNGIKIEKFWQLKYIPKKRMSLKQYENRITELIKECIKVRLKSDVPLGVFLSGGIDSSTVVALMNEVSNEPIKTFTIGFQDEDYSEIKYARQIAEAFGTEHHEFIVKPETLKILPKLVWHYNEPFGDSSCIPTYHAAKITRQFVKVALNGDGGDESFVGYERYKGIKLSRYFDKFPKTSLKIIGETIGKLSKLSPRKEYQDYIRHASNFLISIYKEPALFDRYSSWVNFLKEDDKKSLYTDQMKELAKESRPHQYLVEKFKGTIANNIVEKIIGTELASSAVDDLMVKMEIATAANSLESRGPFLDHHCMEFMASVPLEFKLKGLTSKYILKRILSRRIPENLLHRKKMGFGVPIGRWFRNEMKDFIYDILLEEKSIKRGYFNKDYIKQLLDKHVSGSSDNKNQIWALLNFELWHRIFIEKESI